MTDVKAEDRIVAYIRLFLWYKQTPVDVYLEVAAADVMKYNLHWQGLVVDANDGRD